MKSYLLTLVAVVLAGAAMFFWGFLYWGTTSLPYTPWLKSADDMAAGAALKQHFPQSGTYFVPARRDDTKAMTKLAQQGPVAMVHIVPGGDTMPNPMRMGMGFVLCVAAAACLAMVLRLSARGLPTYASRVMVAALVGLTAAVLVDLGDAIWWYAALEWKLVQAFYDLTTCMAAGLVLAAFVRSPARQPLPSKGE